MIAIRGAKSAIAQELTKLLPRCESLAVVAREDEPPLDAGRYLFCAGLLQAKRIAEQDCNEVGDSFLVNAGDVIRDCDRIITSNPKARICIIGSESGFSWSFDGAYAAAKAAVHRYVETKRLTDARQQLVCVAPSIIGDAGMTLRRHDRLVLERKKAGHPKGRFLRAFEVARLVHHVLYVDEGYLSGVVIRMNGGQHT